VKGWVVLLVVFLLGVWLSAPVKGVFKKL